MTTFATYVHGAPESRSGYLWKQSPSTLRLRKYQWRYVSVENGGLYWWNTDQMAQDVGVLGCKGSVSFITNRCEVELCEDADARFFVRPIGGKWEVGGTFTAKKEGEARTFTFDTTKSSHRAWEWVATIQAHIDYAERLKEEELENQHDEDPEDVAPELEQEEIPAFRIGQSEKVLQDALSDAPVLEKQTSFQGSVEKVSTSEGLSSTPKLDPDAVQRQEEAAREKAMLEKEKEELAREKAALVKAREEIAAKEKAVLEKAKADTAVAVAKARSEKAAVERQAASDKKARSEKEKEPTADDEMLAGKEADVKPTAAPKRMVPKFGGIKVQLGEIDAEQGGDSAVNAQEEVAPSAGKKGAAALLKGLKSGEVAKLVDTMEEEVAPPSANEDITPSAKKKGASALLKGLRSGEVAKLVDTMEEQSASSTLPRKSQQHVSLDLPRASQLNALDLTQRQDDVARNIPRASTFSMQAARDSTLKDRRMSRTPPKRLLEEGQSLDESPPGSRRSTRLSQRDVGDRRPSRTPPRAPSLSSTVGKESRIEFCPECHNYFEDDGRFCENCGWKRDVRKRDASPGVRKKPPTTGPLVPAFRARLREIQGFPVTRRARSVETSNRETQQRANDSISGAGVAFKLTRPSSLKTGRTIPEKPEDPVVIPGDFYEYFTKIWPRGRDYESRRVRRVLFRKFDINLNDHIGPVEVKTVIARMIDIPGMNDFSPAVNLAFQSMQGVMPLDGDIEGECLSLRCFRIFLMFLSRYMELWVHFCAMNKSWTRRATLDEFKEAIPNFKSLALENYEEVAAQPEAFWDEIPKASEFYIKFNEFCMFVGSYCPQRDKWETDIEPEDLLKECGDTSYRDGAKFRCIVPSFHEMRAKFPLERSETGIAARAKIYKQFDFNNMCGKILPFEADITINNVIAVPGVHTLLPAVRLAFKYTQQNRKLDYDAVQQGLAWDSFYALLYYLQHFFELWVRFIAFDAVRDYRLSCEEFTAMILQLQLCGIVSDEVMGQIREDPVKVFKLVDKDNSGYIRFKEFAGFCLENGPPEPDLSGDPMPPSISKYFEMAAAGKFKKPPKVEAPPEVHEKKKHPPVPRFPHPKNPKAQVQAEVHEKKKRPPVPRFAHGNRKNGDGEEQLARSPSPSPKKVEKSSPARSPSPAQKKADNPPPVKQDSEDEGDEETTRPDIPTNEADDTQAEIAKEAPSEEAKKELAADKEDKKETPSEEAKKELSANEEVNDEKKVKEVKAVEKDVKEVEAAKTKMAANASAEEKTPEMKEKEVAKDEGNVVSAEEKTPEMKEKADVEEQPPPSVQANTNSSLEVAPLEPEPPEVDAGDRVAVEEPTQSKEYPTSSNATSTGEAPVGAKVALPKGPPPVSTSVQQVAANPKQSLEERMAAFKAKLSAPPAKLAAAPPSKAPSAETPEPTESAPTNAGDGTVQPPSEATTESIEKRASQIGTGMAPPPPAPTVANPKQSMEERLAAFKAKMSAPPGKTVGTPPPKATSPEALPPAADTTTESMVEKIEKRLSQAGGRLSLTPSPTPTEIPARESAAVEQDSEKVKGDVAEVDDSVKENIPSSSPESATSEAPPSTDVPPNSATPTPKQSMEERLAAFKAKMASPPGKATSVPSSVVPEGTGSALPKQSLEDRLAAFKAKMGGPPTTLTPGATSTTPTMEERMAAIRAKQGAVAPPAKAPSLETSAVASTPSSLQERMAALKAKQADIAAKQAVLAAKTDPSPETFSNLPTAASMSDVKP